MRLRNFNEMFYKKGFNRKRDSSFPYFATPFELASLEHSLFLQGIVN